MDYTPEQIARQMTAGYKAAHPGFAVRPEHVVKVLTMRKPAYGSYDICDWPTNDQQRTILHFAFSDYRAAKANARPAIPCPEPSEPCAKAAAYRLGMANGYRTGVDWDGMTPLGVAYAGGAEMGRFWRPDADESDDMVCDGHPAGAFDPMGETVYCDGSCRR